MSGENTGTIGKAGRGGKKTTDSFFPNIIRLT